MKLDHSHGSQQQRIHYQNNNVTAGIVFFLLRTELRASSSAATATKTATKTSFYFFDKCCKRISWSGRIKFYCIVFIVLYCIVLRNWPV